MMRIPLLAVTIAMLLGAAVVTSGCADRTEPPPPVVPGTTPAVDPPGIYEISDDRVRAVGVLDWIDLEGGFWAVTGVAETDGAESTVVAVITNPDSLDIDLEEVRGRYVEVTGELLDGPSIRMAGPEIEASSITIVGEDE